MLSLLTIEEDGDAHSKRPVTSTVSVYTGRYNRAVPCQPSCMNACWASTARHGLEAFTLANITVLV